MATLKVKYKGLSDIRSMTVAELAAVGITVKDDLVWVRRSILDPVIEIEDPPDELLEVFKAEGTFQVVDDVQKPLVNSDVSKADDTGAIVRKGSA